MPNVTLNQTEITQARTFAEAVVGETYNRFNQNLATRIDRIFYGKIGEIAFLKYLQENHITPQVDGMFEVYDGETNVDEFDFITETGESIDVKTAYKRFHIRILIPYDQFEGGRAKDFYVGTKTLDDGHTVDVIGFISKEDLEDNGSRDFGEGRAYWQFLNRLRPIVQILQYFQE